MRHLPSLQRRVIPPIPVKHRVYPFRVTVCIAAICQEKGEPRIVQCSDTRTSAGGWGSTDATFKFHHLEKGWIAQVAIRQDSAIELVARIKEQFLNAQLDTLRNTLDALHRAIGEFSTSPLYAPYCCELIVSGFIDGTPMVIVIQGDAAQKGKLTIRMASDFAAIGSGADIATVILNCRDYSRLNDLRYAIYFVYEAKKLSEKAEGVGPGTSMFWIGPDQGPGDCGWVGVPGANHLDEIFNSYGIGANFTIDPFPEYFNSAIEPYPQRPTDDPSLPPPSPESPE